MKAGKVEYRLDKTAIIHCPIGKMSFGKEKLVENFTALMDAILKAKPATAKGQYDKSVAIASTMGPGVIDSIKGLVFSLNVNIFAGSGRKSLTASRGNDIMVT